MTIARDIQTGAILGQRVGILRPVEGDRIVIFSKDGYRTVPASSVRLEELR